MTRGYISLKFLPGRYVSIVSISAQSIKEEDESVKAREKAP